MSFKSHQILSCCLPQKNTARFLHVSTWLKKMIFLDTEPAGMLVNTNWMNNNVWQDWSGPAVSAPLIYNPTLTVQTLACVCPGMCVYVYI